MSKYITEPKTSSYAELCDMYKAFRLPSFQRFYAWKNKQIEDFFSAIVENEQGYFFGMIVCIVPTGSEQKDLVIIDGQQRMTTINIALVVLRDIFQSLVEKRKDLESDIRKINHHLKYYNVDQDEYVIRFLPYKSNLKAIFDALIEKASFFTGPEYRKYDDAQKNYIRNYKITQALLNDYAQGDIEKLKLFYTKIKDLQFVPIICGSEADVQVIYEGLNSTGLALNVSDLVKNKVMNLADEDHKEEVEDSWEEIEKIFQAVNINLLPKFLRHQWIAKHGYILSKDLYSAIVKELGSEDNMPTSYSRELLSDAQIYTTLLKGHDESKKLGIILKGQSEIQKKFLSFKYLGNLQVYELLLALIKRYETNHVKFKPKALSNILDKLWNFCFRSHFVSINPSKYEKIFADFCLDISKANPDQIANKGNQVFKKLAKLVDSKTQFTDNFAEQLNYSDSKLVVMVFERLFAVENKKIQLSEQSIEHIVPQDPKEWGLNKKQVRGYVNKIGNLTLLHPIDNNNAKNKSMDYKCKKVYSCSDFKYNRELAIKWKTSFEKDPGSAVYDRSSEIAKAANLIFKV